MINARRLETFVAIFELYLYKSYPIYIQDCQQQTHWAWNELSSHFQKDFSNNRERYGTETLATNLYKALHAIGWNGDSITLPRLKKKGSWQAEVFFTIDFVKLPKWIGTTWNFSMRLKYMLAEYHRLNGLDHRTKTFFPSSLRFDSFSYNSCVNRPFCLAFVPSIVLYWNFESDRFLVQAYSSVVTRQSLPAITAQL